MFLAKEKKENKHYSEYYNEETKIILPKNLQKISIILGTNLKVQMTD